MNPTTTSGGRLWHSMLDARLAERPEDGIGANVCKRVLKGQTLKDSV